MRLVSCAVLAALSVAWGSPANASWHEAKSDHFIIYADQSPNRTRDLALQLERFDSAARQLLGLSNPPLTDSQRVVVFVVPNLRDVAKLSGVNYAAGFYNSRVEGSQAFVPNTDGLSTDYSRIILYHEYTHHLQLHRAKHALPMWISEGTADFASTAAANGDGSVTFGAQAPGREFIYGRPIAVSTKDLVAETFGDLNAREVDDLYARSWQLVSYLMGDSTRRAQLEAYVTSIGGGASPGNAAATAFGDVAKLDRRLDDYSRSNSLSGLKVPPGSIHIGPVALRELSLGEAAMMPVRIRSTAGVDSKSAPIVEAEAKKIADQFPSDGAVQSRLAEAAFDAKDFGTATAATNKALAANPNDVHALVYRGWTALTLGREKPETANWEAIRSDFIRASSLDSQNPLPLYLFYQSFPAARQQPTPNAVEALLYAMTLVPQDMGVRMAAVAQLLSENRMAEAKDAFRWIAFDPHQSADSRAWSQKVLAAIEQGDGKAALSALAAAPSSPEAKS